VRFCPRPLGQGRRRQGTQAAGPLARRTPSRFYFIRRCVLRVSLSAEGPRSAAAGPARPQWPQLCGPLPTHRGSKSARWLKVKYPSAPAMKREAEEDWSGNRKYSWGRLRMGEAKRKQRQKNSATQKLIAQFPECCFCGGTRPSAAREHMPPILVRRCASARRSCHAGL
jgi:hypothetical protein